MRQHAGMVIDPLLEKRQETPAEIVTEEVVDIGFPITKGGKHRFFLVQGAGPDSTLKDVVSEVDTLALVNIARGAGAKEPSQDSWELFPPTKKKEALALAESRIAKAQKAVVKEDIITEECFKKGDMVNLTAKDHDYVVVDCIDEGEKYEVMCPITKKTHTYKASELEHSNKTAKEVEQEIRHQLGEGKKADKDYDKDGEVESSEKEHKGAVDKAVKKEKKDDDKDSDDKKEGKKGEEEEECMKEETETPEPVVEADKTLFDPMTDKDENPKPNKDEQSIAKSNEKVTCPASTLRLLKTEIDEAAKESKYYVGRDEETAKFYNNLAIAMQTLHDKLKEGTVESMQKAQIEFSSWMSIMQHKVPSQVTDFIMKGGKPTPLKDFYKEVKLKK